jgi:hypothetical protein
MGQNFDDYPGFQETLGMPILLQHSVSTTPLRQWGFRQCLPFSWTTLIIKHCRHPIAVMGVVDTFEQ